MSFHSVENLLSAIEQQPRWEKYRLYRKILQSWSSLVGPNLAKVCRPLCIDRNILYIATSSSVVAQDLTMKRPQLLKKFNQFLATNFDDLRFSPAKWHNFKTNRQQQQTEPVSSRIEDLEAIPEELSPNSPQLKLDLDNDPSIALDRLIKVIQQRSRYSPLCPVCQAPTPTIELERWQVCACCVSDRWSKEGEREEGIGKRQ